MTDRITSFQSGPSTTFYLEGDVVETDADYGSHGRWRVRFYLRAKNGPGGSTGSYYGGSGVQIGRRNGTEFGRKSGTPFLPSGYADNAQRWRVGPWDVWINANSNGYWTGSDTTYPVQMRLDYGGIDTTPTGNVPLPRIARAPGKPGTPSVTNLAPTSLTLSWAAAARGNDAIDAYQYQYSTSSSFSGATSPVLGVVLTTGVTGLNPGTTYYFRVRAHNDDGWGDWSSTRTVTTLPSSPPGISVVSAPSGSSATVTLTPPGGVSGVDDYDVERRLAGTTTPVTSYSGTSSAFVATGLSGGVTYQWRARANIDSYTSPWSNWLSVTQADPNTNPGDYFDGATPDGADTTYAWSGTANNSTSVASGFTPAQWIDFFEGTSVSGGTGVVQMVTGGHSQSHAARVTFFTDTTAAGFESGVGPVAIVEPGSMYVGSMYVLLERPQRMVAVLYLTDLAGNILDEIVGEETEVPAGEWVRLGAGGIVPESPAGIVRAGVMLRDVVGTGWSQWLGGETFRMDSAMVSLGSFAYFDGATPDTSLYEYAWDGPTNAARSTRTTLEQSTIDPLLDPDCPPLPAPPSVPVVLSDCIEEVGTWRRYTVQIPESEVRLFGATLPTLKLITGGSPERQVRIRVFPNPDGVPAELVDMSEWEAEMILSFIPADTIITLDGVTELVWAEVDGGDPIPANRLLYGTGGAPATWPVLDCGIGYIFTLDVPLDAPSGNLETQIILTQRM
jgi:hypothetical protein